jgi:hypothetical protein
VVGLGKIKKKKKTAAFFFFFFFCCFEMNNNNNNETSEGGGMGKVKQEFNSLVDTVEKRIKELEEKETHWAALEASMEEHASKVSDKITLDIGKLHITWNVFFC